MRLSLSSFSRAPRNLVTAHRSRRTRGTGVLFALVASVLTVVSQNVAVPTASAAPSLACDGRTIYVQNSAGAVRSFDTVTRTLSATDVLTGQKGNALGISSGGQFVFTADNTASGTPKAVRKHDRATGVDVDRTISNTFNFVIRGAVNPVTGLYYYSSSHTEGSPNITLGAFDPVTNTAFTVGSINGIPTNGSAAVNGDMAFTASGKLVLTADTGVYIVDQNLPTTAGTVALTATKRAEVANNSNGIAFGTNGRLYITTSTAAIIEVDLATGSTLSTTTLGTFAPSDAASCATSPSTLSLRKNVDGGRANATDQFQLTIGAALNPVQSATTTGGASGLQSQQVGPLFVTTGSTYALSEAAAAGTNFAGYDSSLACYDAASNNKPVAVTGSPRSWTLVQPAATNGSGAEVVCTITNKLTPTGIELVKTNDAAAPVVAGQTVTYTFDITNSGDTHLRGLTLVDDVVDGTTFSPNAAGLAAIVLAPGASTTVSASYVITEADLGAGSVTNTASVTGTPSNAAGTPTGQPAVDDEDNSTVPTAAVSASVQLEKTGEALDGNGAGDLVTYTLVSTNTSNVTLTGVTITDPMLGGDITPAAVSAWSSGVVGTMAPGDTATATATYELTQADVEAGAVVNTAVTQGTPPPTPNPDPGGPPIPSDPVTDEDSAIVPTVQTSATIQLVKTGATLAGNGVGDDVTYTLVATNTGNVTLTGVTITDPMLGGDVTPSAASAWTSGVVGTLAPGDTATATVTYELTQGDIDAGSVVNLAITEGTPPSTIDPEDPTGPLVPSDPVEDDDPETVPTAPQSAAIQLDKTGAALDGNDVGDLVTYSLVATNTGNVTLTDVTITDPMLGGDITPVAASAWTSGVAGTLAPGDTATATVTYELTQADINAGSVVNTAVTEGTPPPTIDPEDPTGPPVPSEPVEDDDPETVPTAQTAVIQLVKTGATLAGNGVGDDVTYTLVATNTGNVTLTGVTITDPMLGGDVTPAAASAWTSGVVGTLAPGDTATATATYELTQGDIDAGSVVNLATTEGTPPPTIDPEDPTGPPVPSDPVEDDDPETVKTVDPAASIQLVKTGATLDGNAVGDLVSYTLVATNTGNVTLTDVTITDPMLGGDVTPSAASAWTSGVVGTLAPGDTATATVTYELTQGDIDAGSVVNLATTEGTPPPTIDPEDPTGPPVPSDPVEDDDPETVKTVDPAAAIQLVKTGATLDGNGVGDDVTYTLVATNTGNVTLTDVTITDPMLGGDVTPSATSAWTSGVVGTLAPGDTATVTVTYELTQGDIDAGSVVNTAVTQGTPPPTIDPEDPTGPPIPSDPVEDDDPETVPTAAVEAAIQLVKTGATLDGNGVGDLVSYTLVATNTGNVTLTGVTITDPMLGGDITPAAASAWTSGVVGTLAPRDTATATGSYTLTQGDIDAGSVINTAVTQGTPPPTVDPEDPTGPPIPSDPVEDDDPETVKTVDPAAAIQLVKTGATLDGNAVGDLVTYTLVATNTGNVTLTGVTITDPMLGGDITPAAASAWSSGVVGTLAPGDTATATATYTLTQGDIDAGSVVNLATTEGTPPPTVDPEDPTGPPVPSDPVEDDDPETIKTTDPAAAIQLDKTGEALDGNAVGDDITYTLVATNTGNVTLTGVTITDPMLGGDVTPGDVAAWTSGTVGTLAPGDTATATVTYTLTQGDIDAGSVINLATTEGTPPPTVDPEDPTGPPIPSDPVEDDDPETVKTVDPAAAIQLIKTGATLDGNGVGDDVTYTLVATNTGNVTLTGVTITDPMLGGDITPAAASAWTSGVVGTLAPGDIVTATATYELTQGDIDAGSVVNTAVTQGTPPPTIDPDDPNNPVPSDPVEDDDPETVPTAPVDASIELAKTGATLDGNDVGDLVTYTLVATNTGNVTLTGVTITDPMLGGDITPAAASAWTSGVVGTLAPGDTATATGSYTLTQADIDAGSVINTAVTQGTPPPTIDPEDPTGPLVPSDPVEDDDPETVKTVDPAPAIQLDKSGEALDGNAVGDGVTYTLVATNTGNVTLTGVTITDPMLGGDVTPAAASAWTSGVVGTLAPGDTVTATVTYELTQGDIDAGSVINLATTQGTPPPTVDPEDPTGPLVPSDPVEDDDPETIKTVDPDPTIELAKTGETLDGNGLGDLVTYTLVATNTGNVTLTDVTITDPMLGGDITPGGVAAWTSGVVGTLAPGDTATVMLAYTLTQADITAGSVVNTAVAEGTPPTGVSEKVTANDPETVPTSPTPVTPEPPMPPDPPAPAAPAPTPPAPTPPSDWLPTTGIPEGLVYVGAGGLLLLLLGATFVLATQRRREAELAEH